MNPDQALQILNQATDPRKVGQLTREDYVMIQQALQALEKLVKEQPQEPNKEN